MAKNMEIARLLDFYGDMLTDKQKNVAELYYNDDLSLAEIAENEGITRQGVRDSIKRAEVQMRDMEERLHLAARFQDMQDGFSAIRNAADRIHDINDTCSGSREITHLAEDISRMAEQMSDI